MGCEALSAMLREATAESAELRHSLEHQEAEAQNMDAVLREELLEAQNAQGVALRWLIVIDD